MDATEITELLVAAREGDDRAMDELFESVYPRLRQIARRRRRGWRGDETMDTTALVHEAYLKISSTSDPDFEDRGHFFAVAATAMRQILINYAEKKRAEKRGGGAEPVPLKDDDLVEEEALDELLALEEALRDLEELDERQARVVECLFFAGYTIDETADALEISSATVKRDWATARGWLYRALSPE